MTKSFLFISAFFFSFSICAQNALIDSLERELPQLTGKARFTVLADLAWEYQVINADKCLLYGEELMKLAEETKDSSAIAEAANMYTVGLFRKGFHGKALQVNRRAYRIRKSAGDPKSIGSSLNKFVNIFTELVQLDSALHYAIESSKLFEALKDSSNMAITYNTIGSIYQKELDWKQCIEYGHKAYEIASRIGFDYAIGGAAGNIALGEDGLKREDEALKWYEVAQDAFIRAGSAVDLATVTNNLGFIYHKRNQIDKAIEAYNRALKMAEEIGEEYGTAMYCANLGGIYNELKNYTEAERYFMRSLPVAEKEKLGRVQLQCYNGLAMVYSNTGRSNEAVPFLRKYIDLRNTLYQEERSAQMSEMLTKYETEKKESENQILRLENEAKDQERRFLMIGSGILLVLLIMIAALIVANNRRRMNLKMQQEIVKEREAGLIAVFDSTEEERRRIAKDLHDGIGQQLSGLKLGWEVVKQKISTTSEEDQQRIQQLTAVLDESANDVRTISHQMMPKALQEKGILSALEEMLDKSLGLAGMKYEFDHFQVNELRMDERKEVGLYRVAQELINNVIKHSKASLVNVQLRLIKGNVILSIEDNGVGYDIHQHSDGLGMTSMRSRLNVIGGELHVESNQGRGVHSTVRLRVNEVI